MPSRFYQLLTLFLFASPAIAQIQFSDRSDLLETRDVHSAVPVAIADMNGDGLDDIIALNFGNEIFVQYQSPDPDRRFVRYKSPVTVDIEVQNDVCIADFNNDGANDIFTIGSFDKAKILYSIPYTYDYEFTTLGGTSFFSQGASAGDFNGDGWVDVVVLNDNGLNYSLINDGAGHLVVENYINFMTDPPSDNSGNYGSVYTDFDMDGDVDFYIAKCRQGVNNPADPRRINALYVNDGNYNYIEDAANFGLASGRQSWTADFGDIDNDGDQDVFMTQHDVISELFENIDNDTFINITASSGLNIGGIPLQGMFRDFDNDGFLDLLVSGDRIDYYRNNGDKTFSKEIPFGEVVFGTYALGDLNNDGFTDVYASRVIPFNNPDLLREDLLFMCEPNGNHFLSLNLENTTGNSSAIGAMAMLYGTWGVQIREVRGGEQYGVSNSHKLIFGLGAETSYDSLIIRWPDGMKENYNDLALDMTWNIQRGGCFTTSEKIWEHVDAICGTDSITLKIDNVSGPVQWSTGSLSDSIVIKTGGLYFAEYRDENDCPVRTIPLEIIVDPDTVKPMIIHGNNHQLCHGDAITLSVSRGLGYEWVTGDTVKTIDVTQTGSYYAAVQGFCFPLQSDTIFLEFNFPESPLTIQDTFSIGETATLTAQGDSINWYSDSLGENLIGTGAVIVLDGLIETTTVYAANLNAIPGVPYEVGPSQHFGTKYNGAFINGGLVFEVVNPLILEEIKVFTDSAGIRIIEIRDGDDFFFEHQVYIEPGTTTISLGVMLPTGSYTIGTNTDMNNAEFGVNNPYLWRSSNNVLFPYEVNDVISIANSTFGMDFYYYFYDWKVTTVDRYCSSVLAPVTAVLDTDVSTDDQMSEDDLFIYPNPTSGLITVKMPTGLQANFDIINLSGRVLARFGQIDPDNEYVFNLTSLSPGIYFLRCMTDQQIFTKKLIRL